MCLSASWGHPEDPAGAQTGCAHSWRWGNNRMQSETGLSSDPAAFSYLLGDLGDLLALFKPQFSHL